MAYSEFRLADVKSRLGLTIIENVSLFAGMTISPAPISDYLRTTLEQFRPLALAINTEKSRSEFIIAPLLAEVRRLLLPDASLFSGVTFTVDQARGLDGVCDFVLSRSAEQYYLATPIVTIIEAKKEDIVGGLGQCAATAYAAHLFNQRQGIPNNAVYGAVTTGTVWKFLRVQGETVWIDPDEYYLQETERLVGLLLQMAQSGDGVI